MRSSLAALLSACSLGETAHLCFSGGSTPKPLYENLARNEDFKALISARDVHLWVGDEREAPAGSGLRNSEMIESCFKGLNVTLHPWPMGPHVEASQIYARELAHFGHGRFAAGHAFFDLVLLGMGEDGHTAGFFSSHDLEDVSNSLIRLTEAPSEPKRRATLSPAALLSSKKILVLIRGREKTHILMSNLFGERHDPIRSFLNDTCEVITQL